MRLPDGPGLRVVEHINQKGLDLPVAVITAYGSAENAGGGAQGGRVRLPREARGAGAAARARQAGV
jgi:DNA-binding NtrC family response regulator